MDKRPTDKRPTDKRPTDKRPTDKRPTVERQRRRDGVRSLTRLVRPLRRATMPKATASRSVTGGSSGLRGEIFATPSAVHRLVPVHADPHRGGRPPVRRGRVGPSAGALRGPVVLRPEGRDMAMFGVGRMEAVHLRVGDGARGAVGSVRVTHDRTLRRQHVRAHSVRVRRSARSPNDFCHRHVPPRAA